MSKRFARAERIARLDPVADRVEIGRALMLYEFPWDMLRSLELALFRTYAVPSIGRLLYRTGEFTERTQRRYDDTTLLLYDAWLRGPLNGGRPAMDQLNLLHGHYRISNDDFRYTLATFVVMPIRWLRDYGWRQPSRVEVDGWTNLMRDMAEAMEISDVPDTFAGFSDLLDEYEARHFGHDAGAREVARATVELFVSWYPRPVRPLLRAAVPAVLDERVDVALDLPVASRSWRRLVHAALRCRGRIVRRLPPRRDARPFVFEPRSYPNGCPIHQLGPGNLRRAEPRAAAHGHGL